VVVVHGVVVSWIFHGVGVRHGVGYKSSPPWGVS
jgi:hypothetical protein